VERSRDAWKAQVTELAKQLATEREALKNCEALAKQFVDALKEVRDYCSGAGEMIVDAALEKLGK
jgi:hypothetical protein